MLIAFSYIATKNQQNSHFFVFVNILISGKTIETKFIDNTYKVVEISIFVTRYMSYGFTN